MKKLISILLTAVIIVSAFVIVPIAGAENKDFFDKSSGTYYLLDSNGNATVTDYKVEYNGYWKIPSKINGHTVKRIALSCADNRLPNKVKIPAAVTYINKKFTKSVFRVINERDSHTTRLVVNNNSYAHRYSIKNGISYYLVEEQRYYDKLLCDTFLYDRNMKKIKSDLSVRDLPDYVQTGKEIKPKFTLKDKHTGKTLKKNIDYSVDYYQNIAPGEGIAVVKGKKNYLRNPFYLVFKIIPKKLNVKFYDYDR